MINNLFIFVVALALVIKGSIWATRYAASLAESFRLSKYTVGFIIISVISILPETFISIDSAFAGVPSFGLATLFGSNIADLTLVLAAIILLVGRGLKVEGKILKSRSVYPFILLLPLVLGINGHYSRLEGIALILCGGIFYYLALKNDVDNTVVINSGYKRVKNAFMLSISMAVLLVGAHFTVSSATILAGYVGVSPVIIGMLIVGLGTTIPEFFFSLRSVQKRDDSLAIGDILGTVLADATIVVGILALVQPFYFPKKIIYITGLFMVAASLLLFRLMRSGRTLSRKESYFLIAFWLTFVIVEFVANS
ncbi:MAG: sodium:calcium antiporter [Acidobacteriaceae bacterium]